MSLHSHTRVFVHITWGTKYQRKSIAKPLRISLNKFLKEKAQEQSIHLVTSFVNADHVHALIELPADRSIASVVKTLKGTSSRWLNQHPDQHFKFSWQRGYGAFSVSHSALKIVKRYINNQEEHHHPTSVG